mmetsp:Transcript_12787/g.14751  ORF Transcript_12787/g.14751 Transcript_12787/m.14751 type:complete len:377 (-) Transcript_12787:1775-2905(-)
MLINVVEANSDTSTGDFWFETPCERNAGDVAKELSRIFNLRLFILLSCELLLEKAEDSNTKEKVGLIKNEKPTSNDTEPKIFQLHELIGTAGEIAALLNTDVGPLVEDKLLNIKRDIIALAHAQSFALDLESAVLLHLQKGEESNKNLTLCRYLDEENTSIWWVRKPFDSEKELSTRVGKNEKTKIKVALRDQDITTTTAVATINKHVTTSGTCDAMPKDQVRTTRLSKFLTKGKREKEEKEKENHMKKNKYMEEEETAKANNLQREGENSEFSEEWSLKPEVFSKLRDSKELRDMLKDPQLQKIITSIDSSPNRSSKLQQFMDTDSEFLGFVDKCLNVIGATSQSLPSASRPEFDPSDVLMLKKPQLPSVPDIDL